MGSLSLGYSYHVWNTQLTSADNDQMFSLYHFDLDDHRMDPNPLHRIGYFIYLFSAAMFGWGYPDTLW